LQRCPGNIKLAGIQQPGGRTFALAVISPGFDVAGIRQIGRKSPDRANIPCRPEESIW
jgi:hypothetical protein